jgi:DNA-binding GntR family transcriptional regulator
LSASLTAGHAFWPQPSRGPNDFVISHHEWLSPVAQGCGGGKLTCNIWERDREAMTNVARLSSRAQKGRRGSSHPAPAVSGAAPRLYTRAHDILARRIEEGTLAPGSRLLESHVAEDFGISRAPARQALVQLALDGLAARAEGHGYVVRGPTKKPRSATTEGVEPVRLTPAPSWARIYAEVESAIASRTAIGHWRLVESELAKFYGVSRTVARDVMARLHLRGVIKKDTKSRWYAPALTPDYVAELYQMRWLLEPVALADALERTPSGLVTRLRMRLQEALSRPADLDGPALDALEDDLHMRLLGHCANRTLMDALSLYHSLLIAHSILYARAPHLYPVEPFLAEHLAVIERAESGDVAAAAQALEYHLRASRDRAIGRIQVVMREFRPEPLPYLLPLQP